MTRTFGIRIPDCRSLAIPAESSLEVRPVGRVPLNLTLLVPPPKPYAVANPPATILLIQSISQLPALADCSWRPQSVHGERWHQFAFRRRDESPRRSFSEFRASMSLFRVEASRAQQGHRRSTGVRPQRL